MPKHDRKSAIVKVPFVSTFGITTATGPGSTGFGLYPSQSVLGTRLGLIADEFETYRFTEVKFRLHPLLTLAADLIAMSYLPGVVDATPSFTSLNEVVDSVYISGQATVPSEWRTVTKSELRSNIWYKSIPGAASDWDEQQGTFRIASAANANVAVYFEIRGVCEFCGAADPGATPAMRLLGRQLKERERLLKLLALTPTSVSGQPSSTKDGQASPLPSKAVSNPKG